MNKESKLIIGVNSHKVLDIPIITKVRIITIRLIKGTTLINILGILIIIMSTMITVNMISIRISTMTRINRPIMSTKASNKGKSDKKDNQRKVSGIGISSIMRKKKSSIRNSLTKLKLNSDSISRLKIKTMGQQIKLLILLQMKKW